MHCTIEHKCIKYFWICLEDYNITYAQSEILLIKIKYNHPGMCHSQVSGTPIAFSK